MKLLNRRNCISFICITFCALLVTTNCFAQTNSEIKLQAIGTYASGVFGLSAAEIVAHDPATQRLYVVNGAAKTIDVLSIANPAAPVKLFSIDVTPYGASPNSVAVSDGVVAVAVEAAVKTDNGAAVFFNTDGTFLSRVTVGALPDMLTFTPNGTQVLVANEAEPNDAYTIDPEGSVSIINVARGAANLTQSDVVTADFRSFNGASLDASIRIFGLRASVAQDLEPEYIAVSNDSRTAWITLQENNAIATLDIASGTYTQLKGLGFKNHNLSANAFDASDRDSRINLKPYPVFGMYQPDAIAAFQVAGETYLITANEGDARDYAGFAEEVRVSALTLDPTAFPNRAQLQSAGVLGRLTVTRAGGDTDGDGDYDALYVFGGRSFSILNAQANPVYDSGSKLERITASALPKFFNSTNDANNSFDTRSDNKGPEPEGVTTGVINNQTYAFIGLERIGGIVVYNVTNPIEPRFVQYINNRNFAVDARAAGGGDLGPEGITFIAAADSPSNRPLLVVANEVSGTTTVYDIQVP